MQCNLHCFDPSLPKAGNTIVVKNLMKIKIKNM